MKLSRIAMLLSTTAWLVACARPPVLPTNRPGKKTVTVAERQMTVKTIREQLWRKKWKVAFRPSTLLEHQTISELLEALIDGARGTRSDLGVLAARAETIGFRVEIWRVSGLEFWALVEHDENRHGAGAYIVRVGQKRLHGPEIVLQAPHAYYDLGTGEISTTLFFHPDVNIRALFTNTVHRYWDENDGNQKKTESPTDVCHRADHVFQQATSAAARILSSLMVVQLHGFADAKRRPDAIISSGQLEGGSPVIRNLVEPLRQVLGDVKRFPEDYDELGGTTNAQGRLLNALPRAHFIHVELSASVRKKLRTSTKLMARFASALFGEALRADPSAEPTP